MSVTRRTAAIAFALAAALAACRRIVDLTPALAPIDAPATPMDTRPGSDAIEHLDGGVPDAPNVDFDAGGALPDAFFLDA